MTANDWIIRRGNSIIKDLKNFAQASAWLQPKYHFYHLEFEY